VFPANHWHTSSDYQPIAVHCDYVPLSHLARYLSTSAQKILAIISFGKDIPGAATLPCPLNKVDTPQLDNTSMVEVWASPGPVSHGEQHGIHYSASDEVFFGSIHIAELGQAPLDVISRKTHRNIFDLLQAKGYPHLIRVWNYLPNINQITNGLERYQLFCLGRHQAFSERNNFSERDLPAASTIGTRDRNFQIYFLAARQAGKQIENPRQVSAFHYPRCYGPRSPSFSRAVLKKWKGEHHLYISGTASIVGHESCHHGSPQEQLRETLCNIESLLERAKHTANVDCGSLCNPSSMKIYIRHAQDFEQIKRALEKRISHKIPMLYLQGDICRSDLLLEIEAMCHMHRY